MAKNITYSLVLIVTAAHFAIPSSATDPRFPHLFLKKEISGKYGRAKNFLFINLANGISGKSKKKVCQKYFLLNFTDDISGRFLERPKHADVKCLVGIENSCPFLVVRSESSSLSTALALIFMKLTILNFTLR